MHGVPAILYCAYFSRSSCLFALALFLHVCGLITLTLIVIPLLSKVNSMHSAQQACHGLKLLASGAKATRSDCHICCYKGAIFET